MFALVVVARQRHNACTKATLLARLLRAHREHSFPDTLATPGIAANAWRGF